METRSRQMRCTNVTVRFCITHRRLQANLRYPSEWRRHETEHESLAIVYMRTSLDGWRHIQTRRGGLLTRLLLSISNNNARVEIVSGKLPTYPSPKSTFCPKWEVSVNVGLGEGWVGSFSETYNENLCFIWPSILTLSLLCIFQRAFFRGTGKNYSTWRAGGLYLVGQPSVKKMTKCLKVWGKIPLVATRMYLIVGCL